MERIGPTNQDRVTPEMKRKYFEKLAFKHMPEMRLLFRNGKLSKNEGWRNVIEHSIVQASVVKTMGDLLGLKDEDKDKLIKSAFCHDWAKRLEIKPDAFTPDEAERANQVLQKINPDEEILNATGPDFLEKALNSEPSFLEKMQFYADDVCAGSEIVPFEERINEVEKRRPDLNEDKDLQQRLGGLNYWDAERQIGRQYEEEFFGILKQRGIEIDSPQQFTQVIRDKIAEDIMASSDMEMMKEPTLDEEREKNHFVTSVVFEKQAESGERENEDSFMLEENDQCLVAGVFDGATALSRVTGVTDAEEEGGLFAAKFASVGAKEHFSRAQSAKEVLLKANQKIAETLLARGIDAQSESASKLSGAQGAIVRIDKGDGVVSISLVGDAICLVRRDDGEIELAIPPEITPHDLVALNIGKEKAHDERISLKEALQSSKVHDILVEGREMINLPDGTGVGVLNGRESAELYMKTKQYRIKELSAIILMTDGMLLPSQEVGATQEWDGMAKIIDQKGLPGLYQEVLRIKNSDPDLDHYPRFKKHDDATGVLIEIKKG